MMHKPATNRKLLKLLVSSKIRRSILEYLLTHRDGPFRVRKVAKVLHFSVSSVRSEFRRMEEFGLFRSQKKANKRLYLVNHAAPLFVQLRRAAQPPVVKKRVSLVVATSAPPVEGAPIATADDMVAPTEGPQVEAPRMAQSTEPLQDAAEGKQELSSELQQLQERQAEREEVLTRTRDTLTQATQQVQTLEEQVRDVRQDGARLAKDIRGTQQLLEQHQHQVEELRERLKVLEANEQTLQGEKEQLQQAVAAKDGELRRAKASLGEFEARSEAVQAASAKQQEELLSTRATLTAAQEELASARAELVVLRKKEAFEAGWPTVIAWALLFLFLGLVGWWAFSIVIL